MYLDIGSYSSLDLFICVAVILIQMLHSDVNVDGMSTWICILVVGLKMK